MIQLTFQHTTLIDKYATQSVPCRATLTEAEFDQTAERDGLSLAQEQTFGWS